MPPILDDHLHLSPSGRGLDAVRDFERAGGTHLIISHMPYNLKPVLSREDWLEEFEITCGFAERAERESEVHAYCVVGPYPVQLLSLSEKLGLDKAVELMKDGVAAASELIEQQRAIGIGEVGRPHFPADPEIMERSNEILQFCFETAAEIDCAVVVHSEDANENNLGEFSAMARKAGLNPNRVIKHYCGTIGSRWPTGELTFSVLSTRSNVQAALDQGLDFMMETDYLDDLQRPGAVLSPQTVPKRTRQLHEKGLLDEEQWLKIHVDMPRRSYGLIIEG